MTESIFVHSRAGARKRDHFILRASFLLPLALASSLFVGCGQSAGPSDGMSGSDTAANNGDSSAPQDAATDAVIAVDVQPDVPFMTAEHTPLPVVNSNGGPSMTHVQLVVITYADDPARPDLETFGRWIGGSNWLATIGADYGIGAGSFLGVAERTDNAPDAITSAQIEAMIGAGVTDGSIPSPADHNYSNVLYMVFFPSHTTITLTDPGGGSSTSCNSFGGYHSEVRQTGLHVAYAAVPDCGGTRGGSELDGMTLAASHEYAEAASDPFPLSRPGYVLPPDGSSAWGFIGGEIGDLCELSHSATTENGYMIQRIWSNSAAAASHDPCIPADPTRPYFNVAIDPFDVQFAAAGDTVTFTLTGWSEVAVPNWQLSIMPSGGTVSMPTSLSMSTINNGGVATLTVRVPTSARTNAYASYLIQSASTATRNRQVWPIAVVVN